MSNTLEDTCVFFIYSFRKDLINHKVKLHAVFWKTFYARIRLITKTKILKLKTSGVKPLL